MEVTVKLHGALRRYRGAADGAQHEPLHVEAQVAATVETVLAALAIPADLVTAVAVNGEQAELATALSDGDTVHLFPPAAGG